MGAAVAGFGVPAGALLMTLLGGALAEVSVGPALLQPCRQRSCLGFPHAAQTLGTLCLVELASF